MCIDVRRSVLTDRRKVRAGVCRPGFVRPSREDEAGSGPFCPSRSSFDIRTVGRAGRGFDRCRKSRGMPGRDDLRSKKFCVAGIRLFLRGSRRRGGMTAEERIVLCFAVSMYSSKKNAEGCRDVSSVCRGGTASGTDGAGKLTMNDGCGSPSVLRASVRSEKMCAGLRNVLGG